MIKRLLGTARTEKEIIHGGYSDVGTQTGPYIDRDASKNVTIQKGKTAVLTCGVSNLGNKTVSYKFWNHLKESHSRVF